MNNDIDKNTKVLPFSFWIKSMLSFKFISNLSIIISIFAYYMNAYELFFIFSTLIIVNFILISFILFTNLDDFMKTILEKYLPSKIDRDNYKIQFIIFIILWHLLPIVWLFYIYYIYIYYYIFIYYIYNNILKLTKYNLNKNVYE